MSPWIYLLAAGACEIAWAIGLKLSDNFRRPGPTAFTIPVMILSFWLLSRAMRGIPLGTAYGVWVGIGAAGTAIYGIAALHEPRDWPRLACIGLVIAGVVGLKLLSPPA